MILNIWFRLWLVFKSFLNTIFKYFFHPEWVHLLRIVVLWANLFLKPILWQRFIMFSEFSQSIKIEIFQRTRHRSYRSLARNGDKLHFTKINRGVTGEETSVRSPIFILGQGLHGSVTDCLHMHIMVLQSRACTYDTLTTNMMWHIPYRYWSMQD